MFVYADTILSNQCKTLHDSDIRSSINSVKTF